MRFSNPDRRSEVTHDPLQVAKAECANCDSAGNCAGIGIGDDLRCFMFRQPGKCWLAPDEQGKIRRCPYFEQTVLPQVPASVGEEYRKSLPADAKTTVKQQATKLCLDCRRREVRPRQKYCFTCARIRKRASKRQHMRTKRGLDVEKFANSPIQAEALTSADTKTCYSDSGASVSDSSFSTRQPPAQDVSETRGSLNLEGAIAS